MLDTAPRGLTPWREVIHPHDDIHSGQFTVAEFAADLEMVRQGLGSDEYADARRFFERTYLTVGLRDLLTLAIKRVTGRGGQPVIQLSDQLRWRQDAQPHRLVSPDVGHGPC